MNEHDFAQKVEHRLQQDLQGYEAKSGVNLQHSIIFGKNGEVWPSGVRALGSKKLYAYQADIVVREKNGKVPLVAVELKCGAGAGYTTHDVLTYSAKAARHKELYPYLRYGMAIAGARPIGRKFFFTNTALDFVVAFPIADDDEGGFRRLVEVVKHQVKLAEDALRMLDRAEKHRVLSWQNGMRWDWSKTVEPVEDDEEDA
jgi:hypothetical protein